MEITVKGVFRLSSEKSYAVLDSKKNEIGHLEVSEDILTLCIDGKDTVNGKRGTLLHKNDRICQFRIMKKQKPLCFEEVDRLDDKDRGGFGSTGKN